MLIQMPTHYMKPSAAATTNHPAATTAPHANTSTTIRNIAITVILSAAKDPSPVLPAPIGHLQASSLRTSSHRNQEATTS